MSILVVDDDPLVLRTLDRALRLGGYDVDTADSGYKAVEMSQAKQYDTLLTDLTMPNMDGMETAQRVSGSPKILYMTGYSKKYQDSGIKFLAKPFGMDELLQFVGQYDGNGSD